jgi:hypothetical protein
MHAQNPVPYSPNGRPPRNLRPNMRPETLPVPQPQQTPPSPYTLPPTPPTVAPPAAAMPGPLAATPNGTPATRPHRATVLYTDGQLDIRANDSSLNQILRSISRETGLTITGGVADQRVFGNYGPARPSAILATLLDGTGTNMLLREGDPGTPPELVLTPRGGGPTPPSPSALPDDSIVDGPPPAPVSSPTPAPATAMSAPAQPAAVPSPTVAMPQPAAVAVPVTPLGVVGNPIPPNNVNGSQYNTTPTASEFPTTHSVPIDSLAKPTTTPAVPGIVDSPNPSTGATPAPGATPGSLTPEQVFQQLLQMQQKQAQPQPASQPAATPPPQ